MSGFKRPGRERLDASLTPVGRGSIHAALFDVGLYPAAIPASDALVQGEIHRMADAETVLRELDEIEGFRPEKPDLSLYTRLETPVTLTDGRTETAWTYFYNAPLGAPADRIRRLPRLPQSETMMRAARVLLTLALVASAGRPAFAQAVPDLDPKVPASWAGLSRSPRGDSQEARDLRHHAIRCRRPTAPPRGIGAARQWLSTSSRATAPAPGQRRHLRHRDAGAHHARRRSPQHHGGPPRPQSAADLRQRPL